jgi:hypothetical protein
LFFDKDKGQITELSLKKSRTPITSISEIAANEMLLKEHCETKFLKGDSACFHFKTFYCARQGDGSGVFER